MEKDLVDKPELVTKIMFFEDGKTSWFNENGEQMPKLQNSWIELYFKFLKNEGVDPLNVEYILPNGMSAKPFQIDSGYNWKIKQSSE